MNKPRHAFQKQKKWLDPGARREGRIVVIIHDPCQMGRDAKGATRPSLQIPTARSYN